MYSSCKPNFDRCEREATKLLLFQDNIGSLNIDILNLHYDRTIIFDSIQNYCETVNEDIIKFNTDDILKDGCTLIVDDIFIVLYNEDVSWLSPERLNWTLAHEIGHIYLGHTKNGKIEEIEANWFAAQLLMPEYVIRYMQKLLGALGPEDLSFCFNVSIDAAVNRLKSVSKKRCRELLPEERIMLDRYAPFIEDYCSFKNCIYYDLVLGG